MTDKTSLTGKYAIVTGSSQGLGEAIARLFVERGAAGLIICGRNAERGKAVAAALHSDTCQVHFVQADLANVDDCRRIVAAADEHFGAVHILVNAAGVSDRGTIWDTTPELWDWIMAINVRAPFILTQESIKIMRREGIEGSIVNIGSVSAYGSVPVPHTLCHFKRRIDDLHKERGLCHHAPSHPDQHAQHRLDGHAR